MRSFSLSDNKRPVDRSLSAFLQLGVAILGALVALWGVYGLVVVLPGMPTSESGFAEGLALILYGLYFFVGFVVLALGLLIPEPGRGGIEFSHRQRRYLAYGILAPVAGLAAIPVLAQLGPAILEPFEAGFIVGFILFALTGPLATLYVIATKVRNWRY